MTRMRAWEGKQADTRWMADAACVDHPGLPWIENPNRVPKMLIECMQEVCLACPVRAACAAYAVEVEITAGWWAGRHLGGFTHTNPPTAEDMPSDAA
jgi:hypothetical protein